jgi:hypothetical protein
LFVVTAEDSSNQQKLENQQYPRFCSLQGTNLRHRKRIFSGRAIVQPLFGLDVQTGETRLAR